MLDLLISLSKKIPCLYITSCLYMIVSTHSHCGRYVQRSRLTGASAEIRTVMSHHPLYPCTIFQSIHLRKKNVWCHFQNRLVPNQLYTFCRVTSGWSRKFVIYEFLTCHSRLPVSRIYGFATFLFVYAHQYWHILISNLYGCRVPSRIYSIGHNNAHGLVVLCFVIVTVHI